MKTLKKLAMLALAASMPLAAWAGNNAKDLPYSSKVGGGKVLHTTFVDGKNTIQATPKVIDSIVNGFSYWSNQAQPYGYEATKNIYATAKRGPVGSSNNIYLRTSSDKGATWAAGVELYKGGAAGNGRYPGGYPFLLDADIYYAYASPLVVSAFGTMAFGVSDGASNISSNINTGIDDGGDVCTWGTALKMIKTKNDKVLFIGSLGVASPSPTSKMNSMGVVAHDPNTGTWTPSVPANWKGDVWVDPAGYTGAQRSLSNIGMDAAGTIYTGAYGRFVETAGSTTGTIIPGVSKSTDNGTTWSKWDFLPRATFKAYATAKGANPDSTFMVWDYEDFVVNGTDEYSFITNIYSRNAATPAQDFSHIVEISRKGGVWSITKIDDISALTIKYSDSPDNNQMDNEVQFMKSADGKTLFAKWLDFEQYIFTTDVTGDGKAPDTLLTTDVFVASRPVSGGAWSAAKNITKNWELDKVTWFPPVIPNDVTNVPMISLMSLTVPAAANNGAKNTANSTIQDAQYVLVTNFDLTTSASGVADNTTETANGVSLDAVYPNPVTGKEVTLNFALPKSGTVDIELFNMVGQKVATLFSGVANEGANSVQATIDGINSGTYYYTLKANGVSLTKSMTVVK